MTFGTSDSDDQFKTKHTEFTREMKQAGPERCLWPSEGSNGRMQDPHNHRMPVATQPILPNILHAIGRTPLVRINRVHLDNLAARHFDLQIVAKCEFMNPGGSVKDRIAYRMIQDAEDTGRLIPGTSILVEPTSGNTGIGLALAGAVKGYRVVIVLPEKMSNEKISVLKSLGAEIIRTRTSAAYDDPDSHISIARRLADTTPNAVILDQYANPSNPLAHYDGTAQEILDDVLASEWQRDDRRPFDVFVAGAGTGGTITGVARKLKDQFPDIIVVGVDPIGSILARPETLNEQGLGNPYEVEGTGYDFVPRVLDHDCVDGWIKVNDEDSFRMGRRMISEEGLLVGGSSGATMAGTLAWLNSKEGNTLIEEQLEKDRRLHCVVDRAADHRPSVRCVVLLADGIRNYLTKYVNDEWFEARYKSKQ